MSSFSDSAELGLYQLIYQSTVSGIYSDLGITAGGATDVFVALHSAYVAEGATQDSNELGYTGYARVAVARGAGWSTVAQGIGHRVSNTGQVQFGANTGTAVTARFLSTGVAAAGATGVINRTHIGTDPEQFCADGTTTVQVPGHALNVGDLIVPYQSVGGSDPFVTGLTEGTVVQVQSAVAGVSVVLEPEGGGAAISVGAGDGTLARVQELAIPNLGTPDFAIGNIRFDVG